MSLYGIALCMQYSMLSFLLNVNFLMSQEYGHRVRLATHSNFEDFVLRAGLEFYPLGGDPKVLAGCKCCIEIREKYQNTCNLLGMMRILLNFYSVTRIPPL